ncbi:MAG: TetR/AcrR family transcriptional regulator [Pseudomonadota bacterium]
MTRATGTGSTTAPALRRYGGRGGEERRAERRERLLDAGLAVFGESGYHGATVRLICARAGLTERYFYESFVNGEDLLCAVYERHMALQQARIAAALLEAPRQPLAMLEAGLGAFLALARENPAGARLQFVEVLGVSPRVDRLYRQAVENFAQLLRGWNTELMQEDPAYSGDAGTLAVGLVGAAVGIASRWLLSGFAQPQEVMLETLLTIFRGVWQQTRRA